MLIEKKDRTFHEEENTKFENHSWLHADSTCCLVWFAFFLVLIARLAICRDHQAYYTDKFGKSYEKTVKQGSVQGKSMMLANPWWKMWATGPDFYADRKWRPKKWDSWETYVDVENPQQPNGKWLLFTIPRSSTKRPEHCLRKRNWYRWQPPAEAKIYAAIVSTFKLGYTDDEKRLFISARWMRRICDRDYDAGN